jgi:hypothetical protein
MFLREYLGPLSYRFQEQLNIGVARTCEENKRYLLKFIFGPEMPNHSELKDFLPIPLWYRGMDSV